MKISWKLFIFASVSKRFDGFKDSAYTVLKETLEQHSILSPVKGKMVRL